MVAPAYLFGPAFQLPLKKRNAVSEVGDNLVFGFQQGVHVRLQNVRSLLDGNRVGGRRVRFTATLCRVVALPWCRYWTRLVLLANVVRTRDILGP